MADIIQEQIDCSTAEEFLRVLSPTGKHFKGYEINSPWLFRGQGSDWPLIPSLFRANPSNLKSLTKHPIDSYLGIRHAERAVLIDFFNIADKRGLILPDDSQELRSDLETWNSQEDHWLMQSRWAIPDKLWSLAALAQHYGIPTRLLDWTRQSFVAAFFATESALKGKADDEIIKSSDSLVVWALYFPVMGRRDKILAQDDPIRVVTAPNATNPNLKAQQGAFTLLNPFWADEANDTYKSMDKVLGGLANLYPPDNYQMWFIRNCKLQKFTLPVKQSPKLLHLLAKLDITPSSIYPGYHSIVSDLQNQMRWK